MGHPEAKAAELLLEVLGADRAGGPVGAAPGSLDKTGSQTVFGEGLKRARLMLIGEQPGDREDIEGHPFVGPAGRILDQALERAEIDRADG